MKGSSVMLDSEDQWSMALANNNIKAIIRWLRTAVAEGDADVEESIRTFLCWVQRTSELAKKELLTLCLSRCKGLWMFLDQSSFTRVHLVIQRLRNLLSLAQCGRTQLGPAHLWHGVGVPCVMCKGTNEYSEAGRGCWDRECRALKQHIWLGQLVQWWSITGLLPKSPEAQEMKRISQMWKEMNSIHRKARLEIPGREEGGTESGSLIQGVVAWVEKLHGSVWTTEDCTEQLYPPPNLQALLKMVLVSHIDNMSVQAILMYFVLDMANFLQCKDDLLQSFCHAFTIQPQFSQLIRAFWMLDHGNVTGSMELLLSPRAATPWLPWQHRCISHSLLNRQQPHLALRYFYWARPAMESCQDIKLYADVLLQNSRVSEAWDLLRKGHSEGEDMVKFFLKACKDRDLEAEAAKCIPKGYKDGCQDCGKNTSGIKSPLQLAEPMETQLFKRMKERPPCPLSAHLYKAQNIQTVSSEDLVKLLKKSVTELRKPHPKISEVVWPVKLERRNSLRELCLSTEALRHLIPDPSTMDMADGAEEPEEDPPPASAEQSATLVRESVASCSSAPSLSPLTRHRPYFHESTLTLQSLSALFSEDRDEGRSEQDSGPPSSSETPPGFLDLTPTLDGATDPPSFNSLDRDSVEELVISTEWKVQETDACASPDDVFIADEVAGPPSEEPLLSKRPTRRLNLPPQFYSNEDNQSAPSLPEPLVESHNFLTLDYEKMNYIKGVPEETIHAPQNMTDLSSAAPSENKEAHPLCIAPQFLLCTAETSSHYFLELEPLQQASEAEALAERFHQDSDEGVDQPEILTTCAPRETSWDPLSDPHQDRPRMKPKIGFLRSKAIQGSSGESEPDIAGPSLSPMKPFSLQGLSSLPIATDSSIRPLQLHIPSDPLSPRSSPTHNAPLSPSAPSKASPKREAACFRGSSSRLGHCRLGSWWKEALETRRASTGMLPAMEQMPAFLSEKRGSLGHGKPYSHNTVHFMDSASKQRGDKKDGKQARKEEPAGHGSHRTAQQQGAVQGAAGQRGSRKRKDKRMKKT